MLAPQYIWTFILIRIVTIAEIITHHFLREPLSEENTLNRVTPAPEGGPLKETTETKGKK